MDYLPPSVGKVESCGFVHSPLFSAPHLVRYSNNTMLTSYLKGQELYWSATWAHQNGRSIRFAAVRGWRVRNQLCEFSSSKLDETCEIIS